MPITVQCTAGEAVLRAQRMVNNGGQYILGTGDYWPHCEGGKPVDLPWTNKKGEWGSDCAGFAICYAWKLQRHRPGFNNGSWATVEDDINSDSASEDAVHLQELFELPPTGQVRPGDLLIYPTIRIKKLNKVFIGHVGLVESVPVGWTVGDYSSLIVIQCHGPNFRKPGVRRTDGSVWEHHDHLWSKPEHRTVIVRPKERL